MSTNKKRILITTSLISFALALGIWLSFGGDYAGADDVETLEITHSATQSLDVSQIFEGDLESRLLFEEQPGEIKQLSIFLDLETSNVQVTKIFLTSPYGTRILIFDGALPENKRLTRVEGWFGGEGLPTVEPLAIFRGEMVGGEWAIEVQSDGGSKLNSWKMTADLGPDDGEGIRRPNQNEYATLPPDNSWFDCECRIQTVSARESLSFFFLFIGLVTFASAMVRPKDE